MPKAVVVGAGLGGLAASLALCEKPDWEVTVVEAASRTGGKVGWERHEGVIFDTGPSLLTLPGVVEKVCRQVECPMEDRLTLVRPQPAFRYYFSDGTTFEVAHSVEKTAQHISEALGARAGQEYAAFLDYAKGIWEVAAPAFVWGSAPTLGSALRLGLTKLREFRRVDPMRTMAEAIEERISDWRLRDFFWRYATYNGSDPRSAPATLNCICWVEQGLGFWGVEGGMNQLVDALEKLARQRGVTFLLEHPVTAIRRREGVFEIAGEDYELDGDAVVVNADVRHLVEELAGHGVDPNLSLNGPSSMSAWTAVIRARRRPPGERCAHAVIFPDGDYGREFSDIFDRKTPPADPAIYLCAREKAHQARGWKREEPLFVMVNMPPGMESEADEHRCERLKHHVLQRLRQLHHIDGDDEVIWERTPRDLAHRFPGSRGSLYGAASNGRLAAFRRPANRVDAVPGLVLAGGSAHPGGGVPLSLQSGLQAARELLSHGEKWGLFE